MHGSRYLSSWLTSAWLSDDALAERIRQDKIDILVDLAGHTANNHLRVFARKPAPVQATWLGYPNTTGLTSVDYRLVDAVTDPLGNADCVATETLVRLEGGFLCYGALAGAPEPKDPPCLTAGAVTFGSFNNPAKLSAATYDAWAALLARLPRSRMLLKGASFADPSPEDSSWRALPDRGLAADRVQLMPRLAGAATHLSAYHQVDIALDPFPYNGVTTTCEALWMGEPVVTLLGNRHAGRVDASLLTQIGLTDLITNSVDEYVETTVALARDPARLAALRHHCGHAWRRPLYAIPARSRAKWKPKYRKMWKHWFQINASVP